MKKVMSVVVKGDGGAVLTYMQEGMNASFSCKEAGMDSVTYNCNPLNETQLITLGNFNGEKVSLDTFYNLSEICYKNIRE